MRLKLAALAASLGAAPLALAQTPPSTPPSASPAPAAPSTAQSGTPPANSAQTPAPATPAPAPAEAAPTAPPPPPAPPTDPAAIAVLDMVQTVCIPAVEGGNFDKIAKAKRLHKTDTGYVYSGAGFKLTVLQPGSNPTQCHIDMVTPVTPEGPAAPIIIALHNWAAVESGWSLYRNDKNVEGSQQLTTRSWEHDDPGKHEAMFITTYRHADESPMNGRSDTSTLVYSETKTSG
jgi:hypothetical protein